MLKDLRPWHDQGAWVHAVKASAERITDSRWVLTWKLNDGLKAVKTRLCVRGFNGRQTDWFETHVYTASRWGQRLVRQVVAQMLWRLFSFNVSAAFLNCVPFDGAAKLQGFKQSL